MHLRAPAILISARHHGETAVIGGFLTQDYGVIAAYVAGGRGRNLRPVVIPGNKVDVQISARSENQLPFAKVELLESRGPWMGEPLAAAAMSWVCAFTASILPERQPYPQLYSALEGLLTAICHAPSARGWISALVAFESLALRDLGYGGAGRRIAENSGDNIEEILAAMDRLENPIAQYLLADKRGDVMASRTRLRRLLERMIT